MSLPADGYTYALACDCVSPFRRTSRRSRRSRPPAALPSQTGPVSPAAWRSSLSRSARKTPPLSQIYNDTMQKVKFSEQTNNDTE